MSMFNRMVAAIFVLALASGSTALMASDDDRLRTEGKTVDQSIDDVSLPSPEAAKTTATGEPRLTIRKYNVEQGLVAVYQSETGKRILFKARFRPDGGIMATILHRDPTTGKIVPIVGRSKQQDASGKGGEDLEIAGVDLRALLKNSTLNRNGQEEKVQQLKKFLATETGLSTA